MKGHKLLFILLLTQVLHSETLWNENNDLYSNKKTFKPGDRLKIVFNEKSIVDYNLNLSETSRLSGSAGGGSTVSFFDFLPSLSADDSMNISQKSSTKNKSLLTKSITAEIVNILPNNNLKISGKHFIKVNDSLEQIQVDGTVHPDDIKNKKYVYSVDIINPTIIYQSQIIGQNIINNKDLVDTYTTNRIVVSGQTQINITPKLSVVEAKKREMILQYLNKILTILFK